MIFILIKSDQEGKENMDKKKIKYIKIKDDQPKRSDKKKKSKVLKNIGHAMTIVGTTFSAMLLIIVVMMCIVVTVLTVYVLDFADNSYDANLRDVEMKYTSFVYAYDEHGNEVEIKRLAADENRIWVDYEEMPLCLIDAVTAVEDKRFYEHKGVDWQRTVSSLLADVLNTSGAGQGGSTITQQLIKNITGDDEVTWERKLREIFRALSIEEKYTKIDIIESYLNRIWFGGMIYGVGAASAYYFDKEVSELNIAESAILAGMIRSPGSYNPYSSLENCKERQMYALDHMYEQGLINTQQYESAYYNKEKVYFARPVYGDDFGYIDERTLQTDTDTEDILEDEDFDPEYEAYKWNGDYEVSQNWYVDAGIEQVINDYADEKGIKYTSAKKEIYNGGYKIFLNMDIAMQEELERKYRDPYTVLSKYDPAAAKEDLIQSAFVIMDYSGTVLALVGGLGEKEGDGTFNRATQAFRAPGSTMKPISTYSTAIEHNLITYSTMLPDIGIYVPDEETNDPYDFARWPSNYNLVGGDGAPQPVWYAVRKSTNTLAVRVSDMLTPQLCYNQLTQNLGFTSILQSDIAYSPITLGALTQGVRLVELCAAYQIFGNGGYYYEPMLYSKVEDSKGNIILEQDFYGTQAISSDTAYITNRMLKTVITDPYGTGKNAKLDNVEVVGKTGTSNSESNLLFVGATPDYIGSLWIGYDDNRKIGSGDGWMTLAKIWKTIMQDVQDTEHIINFPVDPDVVERKYCTATGLLATNKCTKTEVGYYRRSNLPAYCSGDHEAFLEDIEKLLEEEQKDAKELEERLRENKYYG